MMAGSSLQQLLHWQWLRRRQRQRGPTAALCLALIAALLCRAISGLSVDDEGELIMCGTCNVIACDIQIPCPTLPLLPRPRAAAAILRKLRAAIHDMDPAWAPGRLSGWQPDDTRQPCSWFYISCREQRVVAV